MAKVVILDLEGDLYQGVAVTMEIREDSDSAFSQIRAKGKLPPDPSLEEEYQHWHILYQNLVSLFRFRLEDRSLGENNGSGDKDIEECRKAGENLARSLNNWLKSEAFRPIREKLLEKLLSQEVIRFILQVESLPLRRLPWHLWEFFDSYPKAELALSAPAYERAITRGRLGNKKRILAVLGNSQGIDFEADRKLLASLPAIAETVFLVEPQPQELHHWLWDEKGWDILFFAGHSSSDSRGEKGEIKINSQDSLSLERLSNALKNSIEKGLQLAIFNSCDGLGLARALETLHIPQIIVMREPVPDVVAQEFLKHFLATFARGSSLYLAVREAREKLQSLEEMWPCATWLPVICQNPTVEPLTWQDITKQATPPCPYLGLAAFRENNADYFFGRETFIERLWQSVQQKPLVAVIGSSGSGKSSVVFAGLIPRLRTEGNWLIVTFRPGNNPFTKLSEQLIPLLEPQLRETEQLIEVSKLATALQQGDIELSAVVERILHKHPQQEKLLLVADQFEEIYTLAPQGDNLQPEIAFLDILISSCKPESPLTLVLTLRADFFEYVLSYRPLAEILYKYNPELLGPMTREELQEAVEKPAAKLGVTIAPGLTKRILDGVGKEPGNLPLLEFALTLLWEHQEDNCLTNEAYEAIGGVDKALAGYAEQIYGNLKLEHQQQAEQLFTQLVRPGEGTADTRRVATEAEIGQELWELVNHLANSRLVVAGQDEATGDRTVEIIHEALIQEWQRLHHWLEENRSFRLWQERLRMALNQWLSRDREVGFLLQGMPLLEAENWLQQRSSSLSTQEHSFVEASLNHQQQAMDIQESRIRRITIFLTTGIMGFFLLTIFAIYQWRRADKNSKMTQINGSVVSAQAQFASHKEIEALLISLKNAKQLQKYPHANPATRMRTITTLHQIIHGIREYNILEGHERTAISVDFSPDGELIASGSDDNTIKIWRKDGKLVITLEGHRDSIRSVVWHPDGEMLASASYDKTVKLWNKKGELIKTIQGEQGQVNGITFSPDGKLLASAGADGTVKLWQTGDMSLYKTISAHKSWVSDVQFIPNSQFIASSGTDRVIKIWRWEDGTLVDTLQEHTAAVKTISFSGDGKLLASGDGDANVKLWGVDNTTGKVTFWTNLNNHTDKVWDVNFSPNGKLLASTSADKTIQLQQIDIDKQEVKSLEPLKDHNSSIYSVAWSSDGSSMASASADTSIKLWHPHPQPLKRFKGHEGKVKDAALNSAETTIVSGDEKGLIKLQSPDSLTSAQTISGHAGGVNQVDWLPQSQIFASGGNDGHIKLWQSSSQLQGSWLAHRNGVLDVDFSPDGQLLISGGGDNTIKLWQQDGDWVKNLGKHEEPVNRVRFSPDGQWIISGGYDQIVKLWKRDGTLQESLAGHKSNIWDLAWSNDGEMFASASGDGTINLWQKSGGLFRAEESKLLKTLTGHTNQVRSVTFSPDSRLIASGSDDSTIKIWSLQGRLLNTLAGHKGGVNSVSFTRDGKSIISASEDGTIITWNLDLEDLFNQGCLFLKDYFQNNPSLSGSDRRVCEPVFNEL